MLLNTPGLVFPTPGQRAALQTLADHGPMGETKWRRTAGARFQLWALRHHGLAELAMLTDEPPTWKWRITDAGRAALKRHPHRRGDPARAAASSL